MFSSPTRLNANRANAARSTGPRTAEGKAASSTGTRVRVSLSHGAYATDETLLAAAITSPQALPITHLLHAPDKNKAIPTSAGPATGDSLLAADTPLLRDAPTHPAAAAVSYHDAAASGPSTLLASFTSHYNDVTELRGVVHRHPSTLLASFTSHYNPAGPAETLLVRRIVAASLRIDLLGRALDALLELGERRALVDHLSERFVINEPKMQVRDAPNYAAMLRRYDGAAEAPPDYDPALDPDPALCTLAYTLSSPRAATLMRHEAVAERRLHTAMRELHHLQAERRKQEKERNEPITMPTKAARNEATSNHAAALWKEPTRTAMMEYDATARIEPISLTVAERHETTRNEPTMLPFDTASNEPTLSPTQPHPDAASPASLCAAPADPLPHVPMAAVKNEPIAPPDPILPAHAAQAGRNEPISASPTHRSQLPVARGSGESPSSTRRAGSFSDPLERLIRDAERRVAGLALAPSGVHSQALSHHRFR